VVTNCLRLIADDGVASLDGEIARVIDRLRLQVLRADDELLAHTLSLGSRCCYIIPKALFPDRRAAEQRRHGRCRRRRALPAGPAAGRHALRAAAMNGGLRFSGVPVWSICPREGVIVSAARYGITPVLEFRARHAVGAGVRRGSRQHCSAAGTSGCPPG